MMKRIFAALLALAAMLAPASAAFSPATPITVPTIAALRNIPAAAATQFPSVFVLGYYAQGDFGGPEQYTWSSASTATDDACTVINPTGNLGPGRFVLSWSTSLSVKACGAHGDGVTSDRNAIQACVTAVGALANPQGQCTFPSGKYAFVGGTDAKILVPNNVTISGSSLNTSIIVVTGSGPIVNMLEFDNPGNNYVTDMGFIGNNINQAGYGFIAFIGGDGTSAPAPSGTMGNFGVTNSAFSNDGNDQWIGVENDSTQSMQNVVFNNNVANTGSGNCRDLTNVGVACTLFTVLGEFKSTSGTIQGVTISDNVADGTWIKRFVDIWEGVFNVHVDRNFLTNFGKQASSDSGAYTIMEYFHDPLSIGAQHSQGLWVTNNYILNPFSNGNYCQGQNDIHFNFNFVTGQTDAADGTVQKGGLAVNQCNGEAIGNTLFNNLFGIELAPADLSGGGRPFLISNNNITSSVTSGASTPAGIKLGGAAAPVNVLLDANIINETAANSAGLFIAASGGAPLARILIDGGQYSGTRWGIVTAGTFGQTGTLLATQLAISNVTVNGAATNAGAILRVGASQLELTNLTIDASAFTASADGLDIQNDTSVVVAGLTLLNMTSGAGHMFRGDNAQGVLSAVTFSNVATANMLTGGFGTARPTWGAPQGSIVQNINGVCSAGSAIISWGNDSGTTWTTRTTTCS